MPSTTAQLFETHGKRTKIVTLKKIEATMALTMTLFRMHATIASKLVMWVNPIPAVMG